MGAALTTPAKAVRQFYSRHIVFTLIVGVLWILIQPEEMPISWQRWPWWALTMRCDFVTSCALMLPVNRVYSKRLNPCDESCVGIDASRKLRLLEACRACVRQHESSVCWFSRNKIAASTRLFTVPVLCRSAL